MLHHWTKQEREAHAATLTAMEDAMDKLAPESIEWIFVGHAMTHCLEAWLSEHYGHQVRIAERTADGCVVEHLV